MAMIRVLVNPIPMAIICSVIQGTKYRLLLFLEPRYNKTDTDWEAIEVNITEIDKKKKNNEIFYKRTENGFFYKMVFSKGWYQTHSLEITEFYCKNSVKVTF